MSAYDFTGFVAGISGASLFVVGVLVALLSSVRMAVVARRTGKGRIARALAAAGGTLAGFGAALFLAAEASGGHRHAADRAAPWIVAIAVALAAVTAWRVARRRASPPVAADAGGTPPTPSP